MTATRQELEAASYLIIDLIEGWRRGETKTTAALRSLGREELELTLAVAVGMLTGAIEDRAKHNNITFGAALKIMRRVVET